MDFWMISWDFTEFNGISWFFLVNLMGAVFLNWQECGFNWSQWDIFGYVTAVCDDWNKMLSDSIEFSKQMMECLEICQVKARILRATDKRNFIYLNHPL